MPQQQLARCYFTTVGHENEGFRGEARSLAAFSLYYQRKQRVLALAIERHLPATYWSGPE
jgi:hypothetical protein